MEDVKSYKVSDLKKIIRESISEFKPKVGPNVVSDNKKNNEESYKEAEKTVEDANKLVKKDETKFEKHDYNRTTLGYNPRVEPTKEYKDRIDAQAKGYTSELEEKNDIEKAADFESNEKIVKAIEDEEDVINKEKETLGKSGLQGSKIDQPKKNTLYESAPKPKRLRFKQTKFLNENHMLSRIPEEYKKDGQKIYMTDCEDNEYIVECKKINETGNIELNVLSYNNERVLNEQVSRMNELFNYSTPKTFAPQTKAERVNENEIFKSLMDKARGNK